MENILYYTYTQKWIITKFFEYLVYTKLIVHFKQYISPFQHGFVSGRSIIQIFTNYAISVIESGLQLDDIYTDLSKAFDRVSYHILFSKLNNLIIFVFNELDKIIHKQPLLVCKNFWVEITTF